MMSVLVACFVCLLGSTVVKATDCPDLWIPYNGSCYRFGHQGLTFVEAEHYCQEHDSHLVYIETKNENDFIQEELNSLKVSYMHQPDNAAQIEDCVEIIWKPIGIKWNDNNCHVLRPPICEKTSSANVIIG